MTLLIAADIGGTKTILRLVEAKASDKSLKTLYQGLYISHNFPELVPIIEQFLNAATEHLGGKAIPEKACLAIAGPVVNNTSVLPNLGWSLDAQRLQHVLGIPKIRLINDFAAVGYGILNLDKSDIHTLQVGQAQLDAPIGLIGAGTGLGEGFLIPQGDSYQVCATEGGHTDFAARSKLEFQLLEYLLDKHNIDRVSVERVVSGQGIVAIYQFLRDRALISESKEVGEVVRQWEKEAGKSQKTVDPAAAIASSALAKRDRLSEQTMQLFIEAYGAEAGNLALKLLPYGGLYIAGGIAAKNLPLIEEGGFLRAFLEKGRVSSLLQKIPVHIVLNPQVGLIGAAFYAARL